MTSRAFLDANVLVPARVRDVLLTLAEVGAFAPRRSPAVLDEVGRHLPPTMSSSAQRQLLRRMDEAFPEASTAWPGTVDVDIAGVVNAHDEHVIAAAVWSHADVLVTEDAALSREASPLVDCQPAGVFTTYAVDAVGPAGVDALLAMAHRWADGSDDELLDRLVGWMRRTGWDSAAAELGRARRG